MRVDSIAGYQYKIHEVSAKPKKQEISSKSVKQDTFNISDYNGKNNIKFLTQLTLESLQKDNQGINIIIGDLSQAEISRYAAEMKNSNTLFLSPEFIRKMESSPESYCEGKMILEEVLKQLSGNMQDFKSVGAYVNKEGVTYWSVSEEPAGINAYDKRLMEDLKEKEFKVDQFKKKFKIKMNKSIYNAPAEVFMRLARAETVPGVKGVISNAHRKIFLLKSGLQSSDSQEKKKMRAAMAQVQKAINRAYGKIEALKNEENMKLKQKKSEKLGLQRKAEQIKAEYKKKKALRHSKEIAQIDEGQPWFYYPQEFMSGHKPDLTDDKNDEYASYCSSYDAELVIPTDICSTLCVGSLTVNVSNMIEFSL